MNIGQSLQILRDIKDVAFATVDENGFPQIRIIDVMLVENNKLYFCTARGKEFYKQLISSGNVAITGMNKEYQMVRLSGKANMLSNQKEWIDRIFNENPSMQELYKGERRYILDAFCISTGQIEFFDLGKTPIYRANYVIGNANPTKKGFMITTACIGCGICKEQCPIGCIEIGSPYLIQQEHCLHCGLCYENCPTQAIKKL